MRGDGMSHVSDGNVSGWIGKLGTKGKEGGGAQQHHYWCRPPTSPEMIDIGHWTLDIGGCTPYAGGGGRGYHGDIEMRLDHLLPE